MNRLLITSLLLALIMISCEKTVDEQSNDLQITMGSVCAWCASSDSIVITSDKMVYTTYSPCDTTNVKTQYETNAKDWKELTNLLDFEEFEEIDINTCYVCADGCDTWITVKKGNNSHSIRYGYADSLTIQSIKPFVDKLDSVRNKLNPNK
jgi:hypothetical protein